MKQKGFASIIIIILLSALLVFVGYMGYRYLIVKNLPEITLMDQTNKSPQDTSNFKKGEIIVAFNNGTTYKQAKDLFSLYKIDSYKNDYPGFNPTDETRLQTVDTFVVKIPDGEEDKYLDLLNSSEIVRAASKNFVGHVN